MKHSLLRIAGAARYRGPAFAAFVATTVMISSPHPARADQGGVAFWLSGGFGSLAAAPLVPGWSAAAIFIHSSVTGGGNVAASRAIHLPNRTTTLTVNLDAQLKGQVDVGAFAPSYTFATPVLGGQFSVAVMALYGRQQAQIDAGITGALGPIGFATERSVSQSLWAFGDVFVWPTLRWNQGVHNYIVYAIFNLPVGAYDPNRLVNLGLGHWGFDGGGGYTYFNPQTGWEFSGVLGFTYNFTNPYLDYKNGIDAHFDWGVSKFVTKTVHVGVVGYAYQQLTADSGSGATLGPFKSRVFGVGPQIGMIFPVGGMQGYLNLKGF